MIYTLVNCQEDEYIVVSEVYFAKDEQKYANELAEKIDKMIREYISEKMI